MEPLTDAEAKSELDIPGFETITFVFPFPVLVELFPLWVELEVPLLEPFVPELPFALVFPVLLLFVFPVLPAPALLALLVLFGFFLLFIY